MILLINTCMHKLHENEFVLPIAKIIENSETPLKYEIKHYTKKIDFSKYSHIIICGTALKDNDYLEKIENFSWLNNIEQPVLGICSGMQVIALVFGEEIKKKTEIGMIEVKTLKKNNLLRDIFFAYALHTNSLKTSRNFNVLAESNNRCVQAVKHKKKNIYGIMFHPEVRHSQIVYNFLNL